MNDLVNEHCVRLRKDSRKVTAAELREFLPRIPEWKIVQRKRVKQLQRVFKFKDFAQALAFTNEVGKIAEAEDHHPALLTEWGRVTVNWWAHIIKGLHRNDFIMAAKTDEIYMELQGARAKAQAG